MKLTGFLLLAAFTAVGGIFEITDYDNLQLKFQGIPLVVGERFSLRVKDGFAGDQTLKEEIGGRAVVNHWGEISSVPYRREVALNNSGSEAELNFQMNFGTYLKELEGKNISYEFSIPLDAVDGMKYTALTGRASGFTEKSGVISRKSRDNFIGAAVRQLAFEGNGKKLVIDFCPIPPNNRTDFGPNGIQGLWKVVRNDDKLVCSMSFSPRYFGGAHTGKVKFYSGVFNDYDTRHAARRNPYYTVIVPDRQYAFGAAKSGKQYTNAGTKVFNPESNAGWLDNQGIKVENHRPSGALYSAVCSDKPAVFKMTALRSGLHILTFVSATGDQAAGPFEIAVNGQTVVEKLRIAPRSVSIVNHPVWLEKGSAEIRFSGEWRISAIADQLMMASAEDFTFRRGFWINSKVPCPSIMFNNSEYAARPEMKTAIDSYPLPEPGQELPKAKHAMTYPVCHAEFTGNDWRFQTRAVALGPPNTGHLNEFAKPEDLQRRLAEIQNDLCNVIITNGLMVRHAYPAHLKRAERILTDTVKGAHAMGMKVMDHQDYSLLPGENMSFRILAANTPFLQQTIDGNLPTRGFCIVNPAKTEQYFNYMIRHVKATDIDSIKIDEVNFHGDEFCGCPSCRKAFTAETGRQLPADELSEHLQNQDSPLWRTWLDWRRKKVGDFWVELMRRIKTVRPDFVIAGYSTHIGLTTPRASNEFGADLEQCARGWSLIGTEIMSRNVFESYRPIQSFRQAFNIYRNSSGLPVYGLIYAYNWDHLYFAWALNNMYGQVIQIPTGVQWQEGMTNFRLFTPEKGNMRFEKAEAVTDIALLFSHPSRNFPQGSAYYPDILGTSQLLNLRHIPHEFIHEGSLSAGGLKKYRILLANNAMCLSPAQITALREFVKDGGKVLLTSHAALADASGAPFEQWPFQDIFPEMKANSKMRLVKAARFVDAAPKTTYTAEKPFFGLRQVFAPKFGNLEVLMEAENAAGTRVPALVKAGHGKGAFYFSQFQIGVPALAREFGVRPGSLMTFERQPGAEAIGHLMLEKIIGDAKIWNPGNTPEKVLTSLYRENGVTLIHFLNATGTKLKFNDPVPFGPPEQPFPKLPEDIRFSIRLDSLSEADAVSPDFEGSKPLDFSKQPDGTYAITLPKELLTVYTLVRLK